MGGAGVAHQLGHLPGARAVVLKGVSGSWTFFQTGPQWSLSRLFCTGAPRASLSAATTRIAPPFSTAARIHRECLELTRDRARFPARTRPYSSRAPFAPSQTRVGQPSFPSAKIKDLIFPLTFPSPTLLHHHSVHPWSPADCVYLDSMSGYHFPAVMVRCKRAPATRAILHCHANACDVG